MCRACVRFLLVEGQRLSSKCVFPSVPRNLFGEEVGIQVGWNLVPVGPAIPEPTTTALGILGIIAFMFRREKGKSRARGLSGILAS